VSIENASALARLRDPPLLWIGAAAQADSRHPTGPRRAVALDWRDYA
jgi:hypothetical protein